VLIIAERINSSRKSIAEAIEARDGVFIQAEARSQAAAGAHYIDVNAGSMLGREMECLSWLVDVVQEVVDVPLALDSPDAEVIRACLPRTHKTPIINSISLEPARLESLLSLVAEQRTKVIALCQSPELVAETAEDKVRLAEQLVAKATAAGVSLDDLYIDPLVYPIATSPRSALQTLSAIDRIMRLFPGVHTVCGLTNVSYGLPHRKLVNRSFLVACVSRGLDAAIIDPTDKQLYGALKAAIMIMGKDDFCTGFIAAHREGRLE
jgi:cobalamin-dependent methionine synthase I